MCVPTSPATDENGCPPGGAGTHKNKAPRRRRWRADVLSYFTPTKLALVLVALLALTLAACGGGGDEEEAAAKDQPAAAAEDAAPAAD